MTDGVWEGVARGVRTRRDLGRNHSSVRCRDDELKGPWGRIRAYRKEPRKRGNGRG